MKLETTKQVCQECGCGWKGYTDDLLKAKHPFNEFDVVYGCPQCLSIESCVEAKQIMEEA